MMPFRVAAVAAALTLGSMGGAVAQLVGGTPGTFPAGRFPDQMPGATPGPSPGGFPGQSPGGFSTGQGLLPGPAPQQGVPPCMAEFAPLRSEAEKRAAAIKAAAAKRVAPAELCQLFGKFVESEAKVVKFMEKNAASCGIPAQIITSTKTNHGKTLETKQKICSAGPVGGGEPKGPGLGEALGMRAVPTPDTTTTGAGTFDTLSGSPLAK
jgi:hypothetical protein